MNDPRVLVIAPRPPEFDRESGLLRVWDMIEMLSRRGWQVTFGCLRAPTDRERYVRELEQRGIEVHAPIDSLEPMLAGGRFELAILSFWRVADRFLAQLRAASPTTRIIVDSIDLHFLRETRERLQFESGSAPTQLTGGDATNLISEMNAYAAADAVLTVSEKEAGLISDLTGRPELAIPVPDAEEFPRSPVPLRERRGILFLGNFLHAPNRDAAAFLCGEIVPRIDASLLAEHEISIVGTAADEHAFSSADHPHIKVVGWVPSVLPYLNAARLTVVPLRYGAGTKRKVIQALMAGTPTVTTTVGAEGLSLTSGREALVADDPEAFAAGVERLLVRSLAWRGVARRGRKHVLRLHGRAVVESAFDRMLETVLSRSPLPAVESLEVADTISRTPEYSNLVAAVRSAIESDVPEGANVLVASRGDDGFIDLDSRSGWHFPRHEDGRYAGHYPADSNEAVAHLQTLRERGATHLALPKTAFWWLEHYEGLRRYLDADCERIRADDDVIVYGLAAQINGGGDSAPAELAGVTSEKIRALRPTALAAASRYRNGFERQRVLVLGVYMAGKPNTAAHVAAAMSAAEDFEVHQRWAALGDEAATGELGSLTPLVVTEPAPKYALLNRLMDEGDDLDSYDFVLTTDDDIVVPDAFVDLFLGVQASLGFELAQPARTLNSHVDHPIVLQQRGVLARRTLFVEIGPLVSFGRGAFDLVFPFDEANPMGWGFENVWSHLLRERDMKQGIVDAVPVDHSIRAPVANYRWTDANDDRERYFASHAHIPYDECFQVLDVVGLEQ